MASRVSIAECNAQRIRVLLDADVLIRARQRSGHVELARVLQIERSLRTTAATTRWEVLGARPLVVPADVRKVEDDEAWLRAQTDAVPLGFLEARELALLGAEPPAVPRAQADLGDALLVSFARALRPSPVAIASLNAADFDRFDVPLVSDFLP